jgi:hypothetical protein
MRLKRKYCGIELTNNLIELNSIGQLSEIDGKDFIPCGKFFISNGDYYTGTEKKIIINIKDLKNSKNHNDPKRLNGCCGLDGTDGPNKLCLNGHEIGTEKSELLDGACDSP